MASSSSSSSVTLRMKFDVFLSFRGEDTRNNFTDHLYAALVQKGFDTFRDEEKLLRGTEISSELLDAIEESWIAIVVFSKRYAESTWCLKELTKIMDCMEEKGQTVLPVFYNVDPSDVRKQTGDFKKAFDEHEEKFKGDKDLVEKWRAAFTKISTLSGWHLQDKSEAKTISEIIATISERKYKELSTNITRGLFGIDSHLEKIHEYLEVKTEDVRFIGIHGMGGIGKTTIAKVLYESLSFQYEGSCFLLSVREVSERKGLAHLQEILLSKVLLEKNLNICNEYEGKLLASRRLRKRKILLVLDDVNELKQLEMLAENCDWFGLGSRVIITTRDEHLLVKHGVSKRYEVEGLDDNDALQLFHLKAFKHEKLTDEHSELSCDVIGYAEGLPLALEVLGSLLCDRSIKQWKDLLKKLREFPPKKILDVLQISYDGLEDDEKEIFLDIACFFRGQEKNRVIDILDKCGHFPEIGIQVLVERSLINNSERLEMHDLIQEMGWNIVRGQHPSEPGKWSRLWLYEDIHYVLTNNKGSEAIKGIVVGMPYSKEITNLNGESFSGMDNLKLLNVSGLYFSEDLKYLSSKLRILEWHRYSLESLPSSFQANQLVELKMHHGKMKYLWKGKMRLESLKIMELCHSNNLIELPDFIGIQNLELLDLEGCTKLPKVHESVGILAKLFHLNLRNCINLVSLPRRVSGMKSLVTLNLCGCSKLKKLPYDVGAMECLRDLDASKTAITELPSSIVRLTKLSSLSVGGSKGRSGGLPHDVGAMECLRDLDASKTAIIELPSSIVRLTKLSSLSVGGSKGRSGGMLIPKGLPPLANFQCLRSLTRSGLIIEPLPDSLGSLSSLKELSLSGSNLVTLGGISPGITPVTTTFFSTSIPPKQYDVYISFRGYLSDTRNDFASHLYAALCRNKIYTFIDNKLSRDPISTVFPVIENSKISVVIFSQDYASSKWCLDELVKILECKKAFGQKLIPVFYQVDPWDVRKQTGTYLKSFIKHEERESSETVQRWRNALRQATSLAGWDSTVIRDEASLTEEIAKDILMTLKKMSSSYKLNANALSDNEALQLFSLYAFEKGDPPMEFEAVSKKAVEYTKGIPLALIEFGNFLYGKSKQEWESVMGTLDQIRSRGTQKVVKSRQDGEGGDIIKSGLDSEKVIGEGVKEGLNLVELIKSDALDYQKRNLLDASERLGSGSTLVNVIQSRHRKFIPSDAKSSSQQGNPNLVTDHGRLDISVEQRGSDEQMIPHHNETTPDHVGGSEPLSRSEMTQKGRSQKPSLTSQSKSSITEELRKITQNQELQLTIMQKQLTSMQEQLTSMQEQLTSTQEQQLTSTQEQLTWKEEQLSRKDEQLTRKEEQLTWKEEQISRQSKEQAQMILDISSTCQMMKDLMRRHYGNDPPPPPPPSTGSGSAMIS